MKYIFILLFLSGMAAACLAKAIPEISLRDKIGQMLMIGFEGGKVNAHSEIIAHIQQNNIGGVILYDYNYRSKQRDKNIKNPQQLKRLTQDLQYYSSKASKKHHRPKLPLLIAVDYEGGMVNRLQKRYGFPVVASAADIAGKGMAAAQKNASIMAKTLQEAGINVNFAPVLDVNTNPENPVIAKKDRSFSRNAQRVADFAAVYSREFLKHGIQCSYKHFPGHGSSTHDSHFMFIDVTKSWHAKELIPYQSLINSREACGMIMTAHIVNRNLDDSGLPATLSHTMITDLLRNHLHYQGVVISDDMQMQAIRSKYTLEQALVLGVNAGVDIFLFGNNSPEKPQDINAVISIIEANVRSGEIPEERINESYQRIIDFKKTLRKN